MIAASLRATQNITTFIHRTGAANIGWTEAGLIAGNDPYPGDAYYGWARDRKPHPVRLNRFYKPIWVEEVEEMYAALDGTWFRLERERENEAQDERMVAMAKWPVVGSGDHEVMVPFEIFDLEWESAP